MRPFIFGMWIATVFCLSVGYFLDIIGIIPNAFVRSGGVLLIAVIYLYFFLENREFLTGNPGNLMDSDNHFVPKKVLGSTYFFVSLVGSFVSIFGDLLIAFIKCGAMEC